MANRKKSKKPTKSSKPSKSSKSSKSSKPTKSKKSKRGKRGFSAGANTVIDSPIGSPLALTATLRSGDEPHDTVVMPRFGPKGVGGGLPVRQRGNIVEINRLLNDLQTTMKNARTTPSPDGFMALVIQAWQLLAVVKYIAPPSMNGVIETYRKRLVPITDTLYGRCRLRRT